MADIKFYGNGVAGTEITDASLIGHTAGSGVGFYGASHGISVPIGSYQTSTFMTNSDGTAEGAQLHNSTYVNVSGVSSDGGSAKKVINMPNYLAPLNVRFTHSESVMVQNCKLLIFDRSNILNHASGVITQVYENRHPHSLWSVGSLSQHGGTSDGNWNTYDSTAGGNPAYTLFSDSPGQSGTNTSTADNGQSLGQLTEEGVTHRSLRHDWYVSLSASPNTIGSKTDYGLYFTVEYL
jgi:hypothetical protein